MKLYRVLQSVQDGIELHLIVSESSIYFLKKRNYRIIASKKFRNVIEFSFHEFFCGNDKFVVKWNLYIEILFRYQHSCGSYPWRILK